MSEERPSRFFVGTHVHGMDEKGRTCIPARFRQTLERRERARVVYLRPVGDHLEVFGERLLARVARQYDPRDFMDAEKVAAMREAVREIVEVRYDRQGRLCIPESLRRRIGLGDSVAFVGCLQIFEIWPAERLAGAVAEGG